MSTQRPKVKITRKELPEPRAIRLANFAASEPPRPFAALFVEAGDPASGRHVDQFSRSPAAGTRFVILPQTRLRKSVVWKEDRKVDSRDGSSRRGRREKGL